MNKKVIQRFFSRRNQIMRYTWQRIWSFYYDKSRSNIINYSADSGNLLPRLGKWELLGQTSLALVLEFCKPRILERWLFQRHIRSKKFENIIFLKQTNCQGFNWFSKCLVYTVIGSLSEKRLVLGCRMLMMSGISRPV